jgi:hypothetical protein
MALRTHVMLIKNYDETLVNGSLGKVIGFVSESQFDSYQESEVRILVLCYSVLLGRLPGKYDRG